MVKKRLLVLSMDPVMSTGDGHVSWAVPKFKIYAWFDRPQQ